MRENKIKKTAITTVIVVLLLWFVVSTFEMVNLRGEIRQLRVELHDCNSR